MSFFVLCVEKMSLLAYYKILHFKQRDWQVVEWLSTGLMINMVSIQNPLVPFCCVLGKDTLWHFPLLNGLDKQF